MREGIREGEKRGTRKLEKGRHETKPTCHGAAL